MLPGFPLVVLAGPSGAGKSTICRLVISQAAQRGIPVGGVLADRRLRDGVVAGLDVVNAATGARQPLAEFGRPTGGPLTGSWHFHDDTIAAGVAWCADIPPGALFAVDEIGPLELMQCRGWAPLIPRLAGHAGPVLVAVRPALVTALVTVLGDRCALRVDVSVETRDTAASLVLDTLGLGG